MIDRHLGRFATFPFGIALTLALAAAPLPAHAWGNLVLIDARPETAVRSLGASVWTVPKYPGADRQSNSLYPAFDWYDPRGFFISSEDGLGWNLSSQKTVQAGFRLWPQLGSKQGSGAASGLGVGTRLQQEAFFNAQALPFLLVQSGLLHGSGRHRDGMQMELGATSGVPIGADLLGIGLGVTYANHAHRQSYYGVSPQNSARTGLPITDIPNGWQDVNLTLSTEHRLAQHWRVDGQLLVARLLGPATSPRLTSRQQTAATFALWYDF